MTRTAAPVAILLLGLMAKRPVVVGLFRNVHTPDWMRVQLLAQLECNLKIIALSHIRINVWTLYG